MKKPVYLDYAATTPADPRVAEKMLACLTMDGNFGNPASRSHLYGWKAEEAVEQARRQVADLLGADPREIVWTSGATESDNLAIKGVALALANKGRHIITSAIEHKAVLDTCEQLEEEGFEVTYLQPTTSGLIEPEAVAAALREDTILVSLMHVNNEIGTITDIDAIGSLLREKGVLFHVDAAQSAGKLPLDMSRQCVDLLSFCAHKIYGPKGIGGLFVRRRPKVPLVAQIHGGGHERGMRSGTLATHQIVGLGESFELAGKSQVEDSAHAAKMRDLMLELLAPLSGVVINGCREQRLVNNLNLGFEGVDGESLLLSLSELAVSSGSACTSASMAPSYVLKALKISDELAHASLRFSFGRFTTEEEVRFAAELLVNAVTKLREIR